MWPLELGLLSLQTQEPGEAKNPAILRCNDTKLKTQGYYKNDAVQWLVTCLPVVKLSMMVKDPLTEGRLRLGVFGQRH